MTHNHVKSKSDHGIPSLRTLQHVVTFVIEFKILSVATWFGLCPHLLILIASFLGLPICWPTFLFLQLLKHIITPEPLCLLLPLTRMLFVPVVMSFGTYITHSLFQGFLLRKTFLTTQLKISPITLMSPICFISLHRNNSYLTSCGLFLCLLSHQTGISEVKGTLVFSLLNSQFLGQCLDSNICWIIIHAC